MDEQLLLECKRKSRLAQRQVYEEMANQLNSVCKRYLKNTEDIEEVLADTFYIIFTKMDQVKELNTFEAVSYTHLDVYKRQDFKLFNRNRRFRTAVSNF